MKRLARVLVGAVSAGALAVGAAAPAMASNEVRIMVDPLGWTWTGTVSVGRGACEGMWKSDRSCSWEPSSDFTVNPGGGPQQVRAYEIPTNDILNYKEDTWFVIRGTLSAPGVADQAVQPFGAEVNNHAARSMSITDTVRLSPDGLRVEVNDLPKFTDPALDKAFYELKFFPSQNAPTGPPADLALQNLHETQSQGVDSCDVARTLSPGDELTTGDADDTVCVTLEDGDGSSDDAIVIDTGDGNDTVLIDGDTDVTVEVDTGRGNDVVVSDTDAAVEVESGDGHDAVVDGGNTTVTDDKDEDQEVQVQ